MCNRSLLPLVAFVLCAVCCVQVQFDAAQTVEPHAGTWSGTWDGAGTGSFVLTLDGAADAVTGKVDVGTEGGNYTAELKSLAFDGQKMSASYDFPLDPGSEVILAATFASSTANGTWSLRAKGQNAASAGGTWTVTRK